MGSTQTNVQVEVLADGHELRNGEHNYNLCKLCQALAETQTEAGECTPQTCDLCRPAEEGVGSPGDGPFDDDW